MIVDAFKEPNRPVIACCRACGFEMHGPLLRVASETGHPCNKCGHLVLLSYMIRRLNHCWGMRDE